MSDKVVGSNELAYEATCIFLTFRLYFAVSNHKLFMVSSLLFSSWKR